MNNWTLLKSNMLSVMITLFFTGMILSAGCLYLLAKAFPGEITWQTCAVVGLTFLTGIISISLARWSKEYVVIYRERTKEGKSESHTFTRSAGLLRPEVLTGCLGDDDGIQKWMNQLCTQLQAGQAALYEVREAGVVLQAGYALPAEKISTVSYQPGEGLIGRVAKEGQPLYIHPLPDGYITVYSGLGSASPKYLTILPVKDGDNVVGVLEVATFSALNLETRGQLDTAAIEIASLISSASIV
jgi:hypothetical protein